MSQTTLEARIAPSGQGFVIEAFDATGNPAPITGFAGLDESQSLTISGTTRTPQFTLTIGGATTVPIPFKRVLPSTAFDYNVTLPAPGQYDVQVCTPTPDTSPVNTYSVYDGILPVGAPFSFALGSAASPIAGQAAPYSVDGSGTTAVFRPIGRFAFATTLAVIEATSAVGVPIYVSAVRLVPVAGGTPIIWTMDNPANAGSQTDRQKVWGSIQTNYIGLYGNGFYVDTTSIDDTRSAVTPSFWYADPAAVQAAIAALPGFTSGGVAGVAATPPFVVGPPGYGAVTTAPPQVIDLAYSGPKASTGIGAPIPSDPAVVAAVLHPGNQPLRYSINGGPPALVHDPANLSSFIGGTSGLAPFLYQPFPQGDTIPGMSGGVFIARADGYTFAIAGQTLGGFGPGSFPYSGVSAGLCYGLPGTTLTWPIEGLPAGTYTLEITWPVVDVTSANFGPSCPSAAIAVLDKSGQTLHSETVDQSKAPVGAADPARPGVAWHMLGSFTVTGAENRLHVTLTNPGGSVTIADAVRLSRASADPTVKLGPNDVLTLDAPAGAISTAAGPSPALLGLVVPHATGTSSLPDPSLVTPTMQSGWNIGYEDIYSNNIGHANLVKRAIGLALADVIQYDALNYPRLLRAGAASTTLAMVGQCGDGEVVGPGAAVLPNDPAVVYSVWWDDAATAPPTLCDTYGRPYPEVVLPTTVSGRATGNRRYFNGLHDPRATCPTLALTLYGNAANPDNTRPITIKNLAVYKPDTATGGPVADPGVWDDTLLSRIATGPIRCLDLIGAAASDAQTVADTFPDGSFTMNGGGGGAPAGAIRIVSFAHDANADGFYNPNLGIPIRATTSTPHGLRELDYVLLYFGDMATPQFTLNGKAYTGFTSFNSGANYAHVLSPTEFSFNTNFNRALEIGPATFAWTNGPASPTGAALYWHGTNPRCSWQDIFALGIEANRDIHVTIPTNFTDDAIRQVATLALANPNRLLLEYSNEGWNSFQIERGRFELLSYALGLSTTAYDWSSAYMHKAKNCHDIARAVFAAAGRPNDLVRVIATQQGNDSTTDSCAGYAASIGDLTPADLWDIAPYLEGATGDFLYYTQPPAALDRFNIYTTAQQLDYLERVVERGPMSWTFQDHAAVLSRHGMQLPGGGAIPLGAYEGGQENVLPGSYVSGSPAATNAMLRSLATMRDPRMYRIQRRILELAQLGGCTIWCEYNFGTYVRNATWDKVNGTLVGHGTGNPAKDTVGAAPFLPKAAQVSQFLGAMRDWSQAVLSGPPTKQKAAIPPYHIHQLAGGSEMALKGQSLIVQYVAWNTATNLPAVGDSANHAITCVGDGATFTPGGASPTAPVEVNAAAIPGVYKIALAASEMAYNLVTVGGKSSTAGVVIIPVTLATERGVLPVAPPASAGGLPTVDGANGVTLSVGQGPGQVNAASGKVPATTAAGDSADAAAIRTTIGAAGAGLTALGDSRLGFLDAAISTRSTFAGGVVAGVNAPVTVGTVNDKGGYTLAAAGLDAIQVESGVNARQALAPILAASAGVVSGAGTGVILIKGGNSSTTRITAVTDNAGNRSSVTLTLPS